MVRERLKGLELETRPLGFVEDRPCLQDAWKEIALQNSSSGGKKSTPFLFFSLFVF